MWHRHCRIILKGWDSAITRYTISKVIREMRDPDKIVGNRISGILEGLWKERTILKLNILGMDYEGLSIVTGIENENGNPSFLIDYPAGSGDIFRRSIGKRILFEFSGKEKIQYSFRSIIHGVDGDDIRIGFPAAIERIQRRKHFRISVPSGTRIIFDTMKNRYEFNVVNLSKGGALINQKAHLRDKGLLYIGGYLKNFWLVYDEGREQKRICVRKADIRRIEKETGRGRYNYAIKFLEVKKEEEKEIWDFIYRCQRRVLTRRSYADGD